jgi:cytochrome c peroxidase
MLKALPLFILFFPLHAFAADGEISADHLLTRMAGANAPFVLDVRTAKEYAEGHVPGATHIPHDQIQSRLSELEDQRDSDIVVYCRSGGRAGMAGKTLSSAGFRVLHLQGDMTGWAAAGHPQEKPNADRSALQERTSAIFGLLPANADSAANPFSEEKANLGRMLYFDKRLSKNHDVSCNSCHLLDSFGQDGEATSPGHRGQRGGRNSPTVYNAAFHISQFWDGRAADVEEQAKGPVLNPIEMAMPSEESVVKVLASMPEYVAAFTKAFPTEPKALTYDNMARAIGAFERRLVTPSALDRFIAGDSSALSDDEIVGLETFIETGCITCHMGATVGGGMYQKLGLVRPYPTDDSGRFAVTGNEADRHFFKVPSLRNIERTAPYFHDGSVATIHEAIRLMAAHQLGVELSEGKVQSIATFFSSLTGTPDPAYIAPPDLPASSPNTPAPDPN